MLGTHRTRRSRGTERIAEQAWDNLLAAVESAGGRARTATRLARNLGEDAQDRVGTAADEAWRRARRAAGALAGRREPPPLPLIIGLTAAGLVVGWLTAAASRRAAAAIVAPAEEPVKSEALTADDVAADLLKS